MGFQQEPVTLKDSYIFDERKVFPYLWICFAFSLDEDGLDLALPFFF